MHSICIRHVKQFLLEHFRRAMCDYAIPFHFPESESSVTTPAFGRLSIEILHWPSCSRMYLIINHVLQSLVISWPQKDLGFHLDSCIGIIHHFVSISLIPLLMKLIRNITHFQLRKGCRVPFYAL